MSVLHSSGRLWHNMSLEQTMRLALGHHPKVEIFIHDGGVWIFFKV